MPFFMVTYVHRDEEGWRKHVMEHVQYLQDMVKAGAIRASGPMVGTPERSAMLIMAAPNREALLDLIEHDPFKIEGLVDDMTVTQWDPMFGVFHDDPERAAT
jgi:uncharacterized protein YciI